MIKLSEIVNTNQTIQITEKGLDFMAKYNQLHQILKTFGMEDSGWEAILNVGSDLFYSADFLSIYSFNRDFRVGKKIPKSIFIKDITDEGWELKDTEDRLKSLAKEGLIDIR